VTAVAQALHDESSDMGMFDNEELHPGYYGPSHEGGVRPR
jgi:hypothetical protein